jgi:DNA modification methylase
MILQGDALTVLRTLPDESVQCCVTSPPYWSLRDYQVDGQLGLEKSPEEYVGKMVEVFREVRRVLRKDGTLWLNLGDSYAAANPIGRRENGRTRDHRGVPYGPVLKTDKVGDVRDVPFGLKPKDLVSIPWRVAFALQADGWYLRSDIIWAKPNPMPESVTDRPTKAHEMVFLLTKSPRYFFDAEAVREGVSETRVVEATNGDHDALVFGQNLGPEATHSALGDGVRLATAILDLAKRQDQRGLLAFDSQIREQEANGGTGFPVIGVPIIRRAASEATRFTNGDVSAKEFLKQMNGLCVALPDGDDLKEAWRFALGNIGHIDPNSDRPVAINDPGKVGQLKFRHDQHPTRTSVPLSRKKEYAAANIPGQSAHGYTRRDDGLTSMAPNGSRNIRSVWTIATSPFPEAHFATFPPTFPPELASRCIKAGTSEKGCCAECGTPWERVVERSGYNGERADDSIYTGAAYRTPQSGHRGPKSDFGLSMTTTTDWRPGCQCRDRPALPTPLEILEPAFQRDRCVVLDPFFGAGTVGLVAESLGRKWIGIELNPAYVAMADRRIRGPLFAEATL